MGAFKKSPPSSKGEPVTDLLKKQVAAKLAANALFNEQQGIDKSSSRYKVTNYAELADKTGADKTTLKHIFGGVRSGTKSKGTRSSKYVSAIRAVLEIEQTENIEIQFSRVTLVDFLMRLSDDRFREIEKAVLEQIALPPTNTSHSG